MIVPFRDSISCFYPFISDIRRICVGNPVESGVSSVIFQGWASHANGIISLGMSLKIGDARKGHFSWSMAFNLSLQKKIVVKHQIFKLFVLADTEVYLESHVSKN